MTFGCKRRKRKNDSSEKKKNHKCKSKSDLVTCSREAMTEAVELLQRRMKTGKRDRYQQAVLLPKCKQTTFVGHIGILSTTYLCIQTRNALVTHNWEAAAHLLLEMLKINIHLSYPQIWRSYFILLQHLQRDTTRMDKFVEMCYSLLKQGNVLESLYLFLDS